MDRRVTREVVYGTVECKNLHLRTSNDGNPLNLTDGVCHTFRNGGTRKNTRKHGWWEPRHKAVMMREGATSRRELEEGELAGRGTKAPGRETTKGKRTKRKGQRRSFTNK